jgi:triosephosphate isomerase
MKKIILNQKSYFLYDDMVLFKHEFDKLDFKGYEIVLFPPMLYIPMFKDTRFSLGAQNFYSSRRGSFTGEVNLEQLKDCGVKYTMVAHHERRRLMNETSYDTKEKLFKSLNSHFNTLLYVGEQSKTKYAFNHIKRELNLYLKGLNNKDLKYLTIVYDPNWAIGSSEIVDVNKISKMIKRIKIYIKNIYRVNISVLYGGIVNKDNIKSILEVSDGVVLGKICTKIPELKKILDFAIE